LPQSSKRKHYELEGQKAPKKNRAILRLNVNGDIIGRFESIEEVLEKTTHSRGTVERNLQQSLKGFNCGWRYDDSTSKKNADATKKWPGKVIEEYNGITGKVLRHYMTIEDAAAAKNISADKLKTMLSQPLSLRTTDPYGNGFCYLAMTEAQAHRGRPFVVMYMNHTISCG
jgi:hypothetical protein